ncbi:hypothetical protein AURDEDRAFT_188195 [Auricularia subglabra TFB-10046 SS5]|uniref:Mid2 domain-containing protein n=1 Tax=Auricularia subglabra (strain TFB-10046 / SS5) TaxID=717982 RepID=J0WTT2_AURST|nr:hypothetical protein AURDEDRAFT_188195 [Auricularia subglabra TFB-10046 SS5]
MSPCRTSRVRGLALALLFAACASAIWIPAAPPDSRWTLTTEDPDLPTGIFKVIQYVDCSANIVSALSLNVFAIATLGNITGSNLRLLVHTSIDGVEASVTLTDASGLATRSAVSSVLSADKCPDIAVDLPLNPALTYTLRIEVQEPAGYGVSGPQPHFNLVAVGIDQNTPPTSSVPPATSTTPQSQESSSSSQPPAPVTDASHAAPIPVALIAGPVAGGLVLLALVILLLVLLRRKRRRVGRRGSWISDINGEGAYDAPSARPQWLSTDIPTITSTGPSFSARSYYRASTPGQSHASMTDLSRTSYAGQPSPLRESGVSAVSSSTRPFSGQSSSVIPQRDSLYKPEKDAGPSAEAASLAYAEAPPAYGPPETLVPHLHSNSG